MTWLSEEEQRLCSQLVQIVGLTWNPRASLIVGWWYEVRGLQAQPMGYLQAGMQEDCPESELMERKPIEDSS